MDYDFEVNGIYARYNEILHVVRNNKLIFRFNEILLDLTIYCVFFDLVRSILTNKNEKKSLTKYYSDITKCYLKCDNNIITSLAKCYIVFEIPKMNISLKRSIISVDVYRNTFPFTKILSTKTTSTRTISKYRKNRNLMATCF